MMLWNLARKYWMMWKKVDILVNNAGLALGLDKFQDYDIMDIERMIDTNIKGLLYVTRQILPSMVANDEGHIINIGSTAGIYAYAGAAVYCATKSAVKVLSDGIRIDTIDKNIKVTTVQPGIVETNFSNVRFHGNMEEARKVYEGIEALKPEDIANTIVYIANQPKHVQISDITIMATNQATGFNIYRKNQNKWYRVIMNLLASIGIYTPTQNIKKYAKQIHWLL